MIFVDFGESEIFSMRGGGGGVDEGWGGWGGGVGVGGSIYFY